jgi:class 3 adenylate cyclase/tetratricopeptide (TPR) repeat protein
MPQERRKLVTVLFCDLANSTEIGEALDAESLRALTLRYFDEMRGAVEAHGGTVEKFIGDAVVALFGVPVAHEDDALRAIRTALEMQRRLDDLGDDLEARFGRRLTIHIGIDTGEVAAGPASGDEPMASGDTLNIAARLEQAAGPGEILIGDQTHRLTRESVRVDPLGQLGLKGKTRPVLAYRVVSVLDTATEHPRRLRAELVGRQRELATLDAIYDRCCVTGRAHLTALIAEPGGGKSRLAREFVRASATGASVLQVRCPSYGEGVTYWPLGEAIRQAAGIGAEDTPGDARARIDTLVAGEPDAASAGEFLAAAAGVSAAPATPEEIAWASRVLLHAAAADGPVVLIVDDLQWAEPTLLRLIDSLTTVDVPVLILCLARPELLEQAAWREARTARTELTLGRLSDAEAADLIADVLGSDILDDDLRARLVSRAGGNPLFLEELCEMLVDTGRVARSDTGWEQSGTATALPLPVTLDALLTSRLDLLGEAERLAIEHASVEGLLFTAEAVTALSSPDGREAVPAALDGLLARDLVRPTTVDGAPAFRFRHQLVRDAAYRGIPKAQRAAAHECFARWLEARGAAGGTELVEIAGYHFEQACLNLRALAPAGDEQRALGADAAKRLERAAQRALVRGDLFAAVSLLRRAVAVAPTGAAQQAHLLAELGAAMTEAGQLTDADEALAEAVALARTLGEDALEARAELERVVLQLQLDADWAIERAPGVAALALPVFERAHDELGLSRLAYCDALVHWFQGRAAAAEASWARAAEYAHRRGDAHRRSDALRWIPSAALFGPTPVSEGINRCEQLRAELHGSRRAEAEILGALAGLYAQTGEFGRARVLIRESDAILAEVGFSIHAVAEWAALVEMLAGESRAAEERLRAGYDRLESMGDRAFLATTAGLLARALHDQGRDDEALGFALVCQETAAPADLVSQIAWRGSTARILAGRGEAGRAEVLAREAVALAAGTDLLCDHGDVLIDLAEALRAAGRFDHATHTAGEALALYERKGNLVAVGRVRSLLRELAPA